MKKYSLVKLSKEENIRRQIAIIIALSLIHISENNHSMKEIIDELPDYGIKNYIEDARFRSLMWNHLDTNSDKPGTNNHLEGYHRQLDARVRTNSDLWTRIN